VRPVDEELANTRVDADHRLLISTCVHLQPELRRRADGEFGDDLQCIPRDAGDSRSTLANRPWAQSPVHASQAPELGHRLLYKADAFFGWA